MGIEVTGLRRRVRLAGWGLVMCVLSMVGIGVWSALVTAGSLVTVVVGIPLTLIFVGLLRGLADWHRLWATKVMELPIARPYRPAPAGNRLVRLQAIATDRATYRDLLWVLADATVGFTITLLPITFLLGSLFYLVYPLLVAVTPENVFGHPFGPWLVLDWQLSFVMYPLALLSFALFWWTTPPLMRGYAMMTR